MQKIPCGLVPTLVCLSLVLIASPCSAQGAPDTGRRFVPFVSVGASEASRLPDGPGFHVDAGVMRAMGHGVSLRLEATRHAYGEVPLYPCLFQDAQYCYQTLDRQVTAGIASVAYEHPIGTETVYLIAGAGVYGSHRVATRYPSCQVPNVCDDRGTYKLDIRATQPGVSGGVGVRRLLGTTPLFVDVRMHFIRRTSPSGGPSNDYFLVPVTLGVGL